MIDILAIAIFANSMPVADVGALIATILIGLGIGGVGTAKLMQRKVASDGDGLRLVNEYVTRAEHNEFRGDMRSHIVRLEAMQQRTFDRVDQKHLELLQTIERSAKTGVDGRVALWDEVKAQGKQIAGVEREVSVTRQISEALERIAKINKGGPNA